VVAVAVFAHVGVTPAFILGIGTGVTMYAMRRRSRRAAAP
jgi:hypothetical protein